MVAAAVAAPVDHIDGQQSQLNSGNEELNHDGDVWSNEELALESQRQDEDNQREAELEEEIRQAAEFGAQDDAEADQRAEVDNAAEEFKAGKSDDSDSVVMSFVN